LESPARDDPDFTVGDQLNIDDFGYDSYFTPAQMDELMTAAQHDGAFGIPDHRIELWHVIDNDERFDGHLIVVERPDGNRLASSHLRPADLLDPQRQGVDAALDFLHSAAAVTDQVMHRAGGQVDAPTAAQPGPAALAASSFALPAARAAGTSAAAGAGGLAAEAPANRATRAHGHGGGRSR
jgi:hypothetical protein